MLGPFMLRRLKSQVMTQMVPKIESLQTLKMTTSQRGFYASTLQRCDGAPKSAATCSTDLAKPCPQPLARCQLAHEGHAAMVWHELFASGENIIATGQRFRNHESIHCC